MVSSDYIQAILHNQYVRITYIAAHSNFIAVQLQAATELTHVHDLAVSILITVHM